MTGSTSYDWMFALKPGGSYRPEMTREEVADHPLRPLLVMAVTESKLTKKFGSSSASSSISTPTPAALDPLGAALDGTDPLSQFARLELDPLSKMAVDDWEMGGGDMEKAAISEDQFEPWSLRRNSILAKYTTSEKLSMITTGDKVVVKPQTSVEDKVKTRLEQLDDLEEGWERQTLELTQQEYVSKIEQMNRELVQAWNQDQRVKALKIVIQVSKMLVDVSVMQFYPSKFVLISDILDIFGRLVYERLRTKAEYYKPGSKVATALPENFTADMVPESAKETCRNWFYKIASIRELVPRLYCEMAILKSYSFLASAEFNDALVRLSKMIRGIGDPLVAIYARCYLCRVGLNISQNHGYLKENFFDFIVNFKQLESRCVKAELARQNVYQDVYQNLYTPALDFILQAAATNGPEYMLDEVFSKCGEHIQSTLVLNTILGAFPASTIAKRALKFVELASKCQDGGFPRCQVLRTLGIRLTESKPPSEQALVILKEAWSLVASLEKADEYVACAEVWVPFIGKHFTSREVNIFLGDLLNHLTPDRIYESHYQQLSAILKSVVAHTEDMESLLTMDKFLPLLDLLQKEGVKEEVCKGVLEKLTRSNQGIVNDPVVTNAFMFISKVLHDSVSALTIEDEKRQIGHLISSFIKKVEFGRDLEQQLSFYVEARGAFTNLDSVACELVHCVIRLAVTAWKAVRGHHTRKTAAFVRACSAYCFITIPSISSVIHRLELYLLAGQTALLNVCLGQADACFKAALALTLEVPSTFISDGKSKSSENFLVSYLSNFLSTLLVVPDNPETGVMYLTRGLINVAQSYNWEPGSNGKAHVYLKALDMLFAASQETYPYHVFHVDSNDSLYGWDPKFIAELNRMAAVLLDEILAHLKYLGSQNNFKQQAVLALDLFNRVVLTADLNQPPLAALAINLWNLSQKQGCLDAKLAIRTKDYLLRQAKQNGNTHYTKLLSSLQVPK